MPRADDMALLSVCINTCDRPAYLAILLHSLCQQTHGDFEVVVVDDGTESCMGKPAVAEMAALLGKSRRVEIVKNAARLGLAKSRNVAASHAKSDIVVKLDDDHYCDYDFLSRMNRAFAHAENPGCIGAVFPFVKTGIPLALSVPARFGNIDANCWDQQLYLYPPSVPFVVPAMSVRGIMGYRKDSSIRHSDALSAVSHREDTIFSLTYLAKGYKNYVCPSAVAYHLYATDGGCRSFKDADKQRAKDEALYQEFLAANGFKRQ